MRTMWGAGTAAGAATVEATCGCVPMGGISDGMDAMADTWLPAGRTPGATEMEGWPGIMTGMPGRGGAGTAATAAIGGSGAGATVVAAAAAALAEAAASSAAFRAAACATLAETKTKENNTLKVVYKKNVLSVLRNTHGLPRYANQLLSRCFLAQVCQI